jgi:iron(III) transport system permease protein
MQEVLPWFPDDRVSPMLYTNPASPVPIIWAHVLRFLPYALALLWPAVRMVPQELLDSARLEGARPWQELLHVIWPLTWRAWLWTALVVTALSLGEVAAGIRVMIPGSDIFPKLLFDPMHYGVENDVAGLCLVLLAQITLATIVAAGVMWLYRYWTKSSAKR